MKYNREEIRENFKDLFENSLDLVFVNDLKGNILDANDIALKALGYEREELQNISVINLVDQEQLKKVIKFTKEIIETGRQSERSEYKIKKKDGKFLFVETYGFPLKKDGKIYAFLGIANDITERKHAEQKLEQKMRQMETFINNIPHMAWLKDPDSNFILANQTFGDVVGMDPEYLRNNTCAVCFGEEAAKKFKEDDRVVMEGKKQITLEETIMDKDGKKKHLETTKSPIFNNNGDVIGTVGIAIDITERKEAEQKLKGSEEKYRRILENANDLIIILNPKFRIEYINDKVCKKLLGFSKEEAIGKSGLEWVHPDDHMRTLEAFREGIEIPGKGRIGEVRLKHKMGHWLWFQILGNAYLNSKGEKKAMIIGRCVDDKYKTEQKLKESEKRYRDFLENLNDIAYETDKLGNVTYINKIAEEFVGLTRDKIIGHNFLPFFSEEDGKLAIENHTKTLNGESPTFELNLLNSGKTCQFSNKPLKNDKGEIIGVFGIARDITERKKAEKALRESEEKYKSLYEFAGDALFLMSFAEEEGALFTDCNDRTLKLFGVRERKEILGKSPGVFSPEIQPDGQRSEEKALELSREVMAGRPQFFEWEHNRLDGTRFWVEVNLKRVMLNDRYFMLAVVRDITERKKAEQKLKESEKRYRDFLENLNDIAYETDKLGNVTYCNKITEEFVGLSRDKIIGHNFLPLFSEEDGKLAIENYTKTLNGESPTFELTFINSGKTCQFSNKPLKNDKGEIIGVFGIARDITERKKAEQELKIYRDHLEELIDEKTKELKKSEEKYRNILENIMEGYYENDLKGNFTYVNDYFVKRSGYSREELLGKNYGFFFDKKKRKNLFEKFNQLYKNEIPPPVTFEAQWLTPDGKQFFFEGLADLRYDSEGNKIGFYGLLRDITERKKTEQKLKDSEIKYRHLFESSPYFIGLLDLKGNLIDCNTAVNNFLSLHTREDIIGKNFREIFSVTDKNKNLIPIFEKHFKSIIKGDITEAFEFPLNRSIGDMKWLSLHGSLIKIEKETLIQILIQDITERKRFEQNLKRSEQKFRFLFENTPISIIILNPEGVIVDCNPPTEKITGYKKEELIGRSYRNLSLIPPEYLKIINKLFKKFFEGEEVHRIDIQVYKKDNNLIWVNLQGSLVNIGEKTFIQVLMYDITERKNAEALVKEEIKKLKELDQIRKNLIIRVSHELKTPLIPVCGGAELLLDEYKDHLDKGVKDIIEMIDRGGRRLKLLINKLLDLSRLEYDMLSLEKQKSNLSEIIKECSSDMNYLIKNRDITLNLEIPDSFYLDIDDVRINQVITNLLSNAIKNTPPQGNISIGLQKDDNWAKITVADTGVGLTKKEMGIIFTRFGKVERNEIGLEYIDITGSGLGLFISKEIVDLHGGKIWVESQGRHKGCTFIIKLPI